MLGAVYDVPLLGLPDESWDAQAAPHDNPSRTLLYSWSFEFTRILLKVAAEGFISKHTRLSVR